ncbi:dsDNA nuclease domain-containing protein [Pseudomonas sp. S5F11]|uniref:dsDNA nuclease domain-containing protein n=1 Tax=Pseudomonas sp. S5F11 TaxID=2866385 RepID=UPI001C7CF4FC|nr:dsDNA nuclease domain-containing protein [Pseudomonas sp. S5F11]MBX4138821.1 dsDNA nuclease domain-containing protein [Pseudomonas sp. S5F11]
MSEMEITDSGGVAAKYGFLYQDCVAAWLATEMLMDRDMRAVRVETVDDVDIVWSGFTEFIQVKAAAEKKWTPTTITDNATSTAVASTKSKSVGKPRKKRIPDSSMVHKSMKQATTPIDKCKFRIVSAERPTGLLEYLRVLPTSRTGRPGRQELVDDLNQRTSSFVAASKNDIGHWVDSTWWQVYASEREIELLGIKNIRNAALEVVGVTLSSDAAAEAIWRDIVYTLTKKSALSRKVYCEDDKTYHRDNLIDWFKSEILIHEKSSHTRTKIYANKKLQPILNHLHTHTPSCGSIARCGKVMHQHYNINNYRYSYISDSVIKWIDEVLLMPEEIADVTGLSTADRYRKLLSRLKASMTELGDFLGKVLLHSCIRSLHTSQPIPASLYIEKPFEVKVLENVHIVPRASGGDELWIGFSHLYTGTDIIDCLQNLRTILYTDITDNIDSARSKILEIKQDSYLLQHDIDELLETSQAFDTHLNRYRFIVFLGYNSALMTDHKTPGYEPDLLTETKKLFDDFASDLNTSGFGEVLIELHLYPVPDMEKLLSEVKKAPEKACA